MTDPLLPDSDLPPRDRGAFLEALDEYRAAFQDVPHTFPLGPDQLDPLAPAMRQAVARGRPLSAAEVATVLDRPPPVPWNMGVQ
jgi:hypothetical protein